ncbi:hypothetical protein [Actinoplanes xinjiangensis]|uniref:hypothetical protein n=1 Tax=Actinoplanes xinjiangensis TaxID=512350 RepID=UPI0034464ECD
MLTDDWLVEWAALLDGATARALRDVVSTYPFEADEHRIGPAAPAADLDGLPPWLPPDLVALHRTVGPVSLPDIGNGWFLHPAADVHTEPDRIADPFEAAVVVFGGDGGGSLYALTLDDGRVLRLTDAAYLGGVYEGPGIRVVADDLRDFLERLFRVVEAFGDRGRIAGL